MTGKWKRCSAVFKAKVALEAGTDRAGTFPAVDRVAMRTGFDGRPGDHGPIMGESTANLEVMRLINERFMETCLVPQPAGDQASAPARP